MASTNFVDKQTVIQADWLNDVNDNIYGPTSTTGIRAELASSSGSSLIGISGGRTQADKNTESPTPLDFGAVGDGVANDTAAFITLESTISGRIIDLVGKTYLLNSYPIGNTYTNGYIKVGSVVYDGAQDKAVISSATDTGGIDTPYSGGVIPLDTTSGRTTENTFALMASQNCRSTGPGRSVNVASIYSWSKGNVSGNFAARQSLAWSPQSSNIASEECWVWGGFRGANIASIYSGCENESNANLATRSSYATGLNSSNISSTGSYAGRGGGARFGVTVSSGSVTSVTIEKAGAKYQVGDPLSFSDRTGTGAGAAATVATVDGNGAILTLSPITGGSGYSATVDATVDNGTGNFAANIASSGTVASGETSANIASFTQTTSGLRSASIASQSGTTSGQNAFQLGSNTGTASGNQSGVIGSNGSVASGIGSLVIAGNTTTSDLDGAVCFGRRVKPGAVRTLTYGDSSSGSASTANRKFEVASNGNVTAAGTFTGSTVYADYAEYFENLVHGPIPLGTLVSLDGRKVRAAQVGDDILGVVSGTALIVAGDSQFTWSKRFLTGEFGEMLYEDVACVRWQDNNGGVVYDGTVSEATTLFSSIPEDAHYYTEKQPIENPEFNSEIVNIPRSARPDEWSCCGLLGQVHVRVSSDVNAGTHIKSGQNGIGILSEEKTNVLCMEIKKPFDTKKGYAVALCLIK